MIEKRSQEVKNLFNIYLNMKIYIVMPFNYFMRIGMENRYAYSVLPFKISKNEKTSLNNCHYLRTRKKLMKKSLRSEERRVGKEGRYRRGQERLRRKNREDTNA